MSLVLGIDTGGTYTDGVIIERETKTLVAKAKALTTREDLSLGITDCINAMDFDNFADVSIVSLSTTLATNAIVEGRGCEVGLLLIGSDLPPKLPVREVRIVAGGHNVKGEEKTAFDAAEAAAAIESFRGKVDAVAISSYLSVRNPDHELAAQEMVRQILDVPVVCAHHLTRSLGIQERTVTAILNARLIPIIKDLLVSVQKALAAKAIDATIMVVKGDGSLMGKTQAEERPIETLLSGPASSIIGATFLAGEPHAIVLDMGGTTTDIAIIKKGIPRINEEGALVGGWLTRVEAADINTYGLGGDSYLQKDMDGSFKVGPQRVWPISMMASHYPYLIDELENTSISRSYLLLYSQATDCFMILNDRESVTLSESEQAIVDVLRDGPHSLFYIVRSLDSEANLVDFRRLVNLGVLGRISVTPTDVLHALGYYTRWSVEGAKAAVKLLATRFDMTSEDFLVWAQDLIVNELCYACLQSISNHEGNSFDLKKEPAARYWIEKQLSAPADTLATCSIQPQVPIIGIGAPVEAWLPAMAKKLGARLVIPEHPEVANAIGSAAGKIMATVKILINPGEAGNGYVLHSIWERKYFEDLDEALAYAKTFAEAKVREIAAANGAKRVELVMHCEDIYAQANMIVNDIYIESRVEAVATEKPEWEKSETKENFFVDTRNRGM